VYRAIAVRLRIGAELKSQHAAVMREGRDEARAKVLRCEADKAERAARTGAPGLSLFCRRRSRPHLSYALRQYHDCEMSSVRTTEINRKAV
jgi:hypothetical protein